jgi:hypothetical protein
MAWVKHWTITGTSGKSYRVSQDDQKRFGCECPSWKFQKKDSWVNDWRRPCQHILQVQLTISSPQKVSVSKVTSEDNSKVTRMISLTEEV